MPRPYLCAQCEVPIYQYIPTCPHCGTPVPLSYWDTSLRWQWWQQGLALLLSVLLIPLALFSLLVMGALGMAPYAPTTWALALCDTLLFLLYGGCVILLRRSIR